MSLVSRYRLSFLSAWLAVDARTRAQVSPRQMAGIVGRLGQARAVQEWLQPWLVAVLSRRERLGWTLHPPVWRGRLAGQMAEALTREPFGVGELDRWQTGWMRYLLEGELARLVWLLEAPCVALGCAGWERWEGVGWALAGSLARVGQVARALEEREGVWVGQGGTQAALEAVWRRLTRAQGPGVAAGQ
ncbi:MAG TPA: hypothetical protein VH599_22380 [Ktedonobacterales bacterium]|jgi:hypothetical protein